MTDREQLLNEVAIECHIDMFFYQLLAAITQEYKDKNSNWQFNSHAVETIIKEYTVVGQVILYDEFQAKVNSHDVTNEEREYVRENYKGYCNYSECLSLDIMHVARLKYGADDYSFMQQCGLVAFLTVLKRFRENKDSELFGHFFSNQGIEPKLVIYISPYGLFNSTKIFKSFKEGTFDELLGSYLSKYQLKLINEEETAIKFSSELVVALEDATLIHSLPNDFFETFEFSDKISNGTFWWYINKTNEDYFSKKMFPKLDPVVSFLKPPKETLVRKCQIYLEYKKV